MKKTALRFVIILAGAILTGFLLLFLVFCIPAGRLLLGCANSISVFQQEGTYPLVMAGYPNSQLDNYTDGSMLNNAIYSGVESPINQAVSCYRYSYSDQNPMESFISYLWMDESYSVVSCPRYWHGFLIVLKPLLMFMSYTDIRVWNGLLQLLMTGALIGLFVRRSLSHYIPPMLVSLFFLNPQVVALSLQYSTVFNLTLLSMLLFLLFSEHIDKKNCYAEFFLLAGIATSYFDLLTYPLLTLGLPLTLVLIYRQKHSSKVKPLLIQTIQYSISWGIGYAGMWAGKWLISIFVLGPGTLTEVSKSLQTRSLSGAASEGSSLFTIIGHNLAMFDKPVYLLLFLVTTIGYLICMILKKIKPIDLINRLTPYILIILMPFAWYVVTANHAEVHSWFTHRTLVIAVFGFFCMLAAICDTDKSSISSSTSSESHT